MKILHFYKTAFPNSNGGVEKVISEICESGSKHGISFEVLCLTNNKMEKTIKINNYFLHQENFNFELFSTPFSLSSIKRFYHLSKKVDIIHYHFPFPFMDLLHLILNIRKPSIVTYHSDIVKQKKLLLLYYPLMSYFLRSVNVIVATSKNYLQSSLILNKFKSKVKIIPIGINYSNYPDSSGIIDVYWKKFLNNQRYYLFVGVLRYYKGLKILLESIQGLNYPLVILGDGPEWNNLQDFVSLNNIKNIYFVGFQSDINKISLIKSCFALVLPSNLRSEAFGICLLEGAMLGKPLITTEIGTGTSFININNITGLVVNPNDCLSLRSALVYLWENPHLADEMGINAKKRYDDLFTADRMINSYIKLYHNLLSLS